MKPPTTKRPPDLDGPFKVWRSARSTVAHLPANIGAWVVDAPGAHACWRVWIVLLVHLRHVDGLAPAIVTRPGATHQVVTVPVNPDQEVDPDETSLRDVQWLGNGDVEVQFKVGSDAQAVRVVEAVLARVGAAELSPDIDYNRLWSAVVDQAAKAVSEAS